MITLQNNIIRTFITASVPLEIAEKITIKILKQLKLTVKMNKFKVFHNIVNETK